MVTYPMWINLSKITFNEQTQLQDYMKHDTFNKLNITKIENILLGEYLDEQNNIKKEACE